MTLEWTHDEEELLIDFYAKHESLHNKHHADYNYNRKNKLLAELVRELNKLSNGKKFKVDIVSMHWNELRNIYNQHKRKAMKNELTSMKNAHAEPNWIWWRKMTNIFAGTTENTMIEDSYRPQSGFVVDAVHQQSDITDAPSPTKKRAVQSKAAGRGIPKMNEIAKVEPVTSSVTKSNRRTTMAPPPAKESYVPPTRISRRRTIHPVSQNTKVEASIESGIDETQTEFEYEINVTPITTKVQKNRAIAQFARQGTLQSAGGTTPEPKSASRTLLKRVSSKASVASSPEESVRWTPPKRVINHTVYIPEEVTAMEMDESASDTNGSPSQSVNDECKSTAMFVESRLRAYDGFKRQQIIFKIHELFYQEDVERMADSVVV